LKYYILSIILQKISMLTWNLSIKKIFILLMISQIENSVFGILTMILAS